MSKSCCPKKARRNLEAALREYEEILKDVQFKAEELYAQRIKAMKLIEICKSYIKLLINIPEEFLEAIEFYESEYRTFQELTKPFESELLVDDVEQVSDSTNRVIAAAGSGVAVGAGVAAVAPSAAMAIATTFGAASTGTAISTLSGAAATSAALAWLGGGTLAAGGGGMLAGGALLAMAGPVGIAIGLAVTGGMLFASSQKEQEDCEKLVQATLKVKAESRQFFARKEEIERILDLTQTHAEAAFSKLKNLLENAPRDYSQFTSEQKRDLAALTIHLRILARLLNQKIQ
ncbi:hypothetical protein [Geitlerinema sp. PCC 7407]|uniref:hypothetical protein n=1 Tax=Geitlerinema sp. PCC 7407 TaxID=1173025 RepID=UPI00029FC55F|nr:hypothetical protein [Geitlerinema sp. PCC 7407]AFY66196.1 hypothetical protein GEI7407_1707 [Geitlerinema sp. PCC 7407]